MINIDHTNGRAKELHREAGTIAYEVQGSGPLVLCIPGMGDLRSTYRFLAPLLVAAGYRVATMDLRGHGDSSCTFDDFDDEALASDIIAMVQELGGPAVLIGNSMGAGAAVIAAADRPELVNGLVLVGPFVRNVAPFPGAALIMRAALLRPWGPRVWRTFHRRMFTKAAPADYEVYQEALFASLARPHAWHAFQRTTRTSHQPAEDRLTRVRARTLVVMGSKDPDFKDPQKEAEFVAAKLSAELVLVPDVGHYPQAEAPEFVGQRVVEFLRSSA